MLTRIGFCAANPTNAKNTTNKGKGHKSINIICFFSFFLSFLPLFSRLPILSLSFSSPALPVSFDTVCTVDVPIPTLPIHTHHTLTNATRIQNNNRPTQTCLVRLSINPFICRRVSSLRKKKKKSPSVVWVGTLSFYFLQLFYSSFLPVSLSLSPHTHTHTFTHISSNRYPLPNPNSTLPLFTLFLGLARGLELHTQHIQHVVPSYPPAHVLNTCPKLILLATIPNLLCLSNTHPILSDLQSLHTHTQYSFISASNFFKKIQTHLPTNQPIPT